MTFSAPPLPLPFMLHLRYVKITGGERRLQKPLSKNVLEKEAAYWKTLKEQPKTGNGTICRK